MLKTIRSRIITACIVIVACSLIINTFLSYTVANKYNSQATDSTLNALTASHTRGISDWVSSKTGMIVSLQQIAMSEDPIPVLKQIANAGGFTNVYVGYANRSAKFSDPTGVPADYDPTGRPWYKQAEAAGHPVATPPYIDAGSGKLVVTFAVPVMEAGTLKAVVAGDVSMDSVVSNVNTIHPTPGSFGMLVDKSGVIIAHPDTSLALKPFTALAEGVNLQDVFAANAPVDIRLNGAVKRVRAMPVAGTEWFTLVAQDKKESTAGMRSLLTSSVITLIVIVLISAVVIGLIISKSFHRLSVVRDTLNAISSGEDDLTQRLPADGHDEVTQIAHAFNTFVDKLSKVMSEIRTTSESVKIAADEIAAGNNDLSGRTDSAAASLQQTAASLEQITATVSQSASSAKQASETAKSASAAAIRGDEVVTKVIKTMESIETASSKIGDITSVIDGIAFQTNILALNAAVEAARAGEQGRGFAVVASEVRSLAQRSAQAAKEIKVLIESTVSSVASGSAQVRLASDSMSEIVSNVSNVSSVMLEITHASEEQMLSINEINRAITQLDGMVQQNAAMVQESTGAASALQEQATGLAVAVGHFRV
ncbi:HAMP domain-containing protein [Rahnella aceris]|jgi:methyl-accepting chemotaxis protein|uniref:methyl-accepting chemotaxis protein n=1 Tax=Rahnella sp. (strain Y9602) TaxID=2703885 RepID=UPI001C258A00|nr:methyl-accepting chemotaxis protein [Rahnella aceris]MBU9840152.1 HAMP domain-containing protein [Rahnella aceris]